MKQQKALIMLLNRVKRPCKLKVAGVLPLNMNTFSIVSQLKFIRYKCPIEEIENYVILHSSPIAFTHSWWFYEQLRFQTERQLMEINQTFLKSGNTNFENFYKPSIEI